MDVCPDCNDTSYITCSSCGGSGVPTAYPLHKCSSCQGAGWRYCIPCLNGRSLARSAQRSTPPAGPDPLTVVDKLALGALLVPIGFGVEHAYGMLMETFALKIWQAVVVSGAMGLAAIVLAYLLPPSVVGLIAGGTLVALMLPQIHNVWALGVWVAIAAPIGALYYFAAKYLRKKGPSVSDTFRSFSR